jgi:hypothetical protein
MFKGCLVTLMIYLSVACGAFMLFGNSSITAFAHEQTDTLEYSHLGDGIENFIGYGCNDGVAVLDNASEKLDNNLIEFVDGFGCGSYCGASREGG